MKKPKFGKKQINFVLEIGFSQSVILFDIVSGLMLLFGGTALAYWLKSWAASFIPLLGFFMIRQATKRGLDQGPQLKIGSSGMWAAETGFLSWGRALPIIKTEMGYRSVATYLIIINRTYPERKTEIARISMRELDVDRRALQQYLDKYSPKQM
ncbi:hypothetical protein [Hymenobacter sp. PAMC 26628]|uniref:hypothetical protein n=1 Tax=Hymenobacter sp. PAMC 26628 TaxID=1484118 RepID=UPI000A418D14|nr:hypothetical protein [Hymenobacter sp. PAMC 26628]